MERWAGGHHSGRGLGAPPLKWSMNATRKIIYSRHEREKLLITARSLRNLQHKCCSPAPSAPLVRRCDC
eukprot:6088941-Prymnesium_polylepis.1